MTYLRAYLFIMGGSLTVTYMVYIVFPEARNALVAEEGFVENITASFFLASFVVGLICSVKSKHLRKTQGVIALTGLLGFLDELSFGERIFGLEMPRISSCQIDGAHDFFYLLARWIDELPRLYALGLTVICAGLFIWLSLKFGGAFKKKVLEIYGFPLVILMLCFCITLFVALVIDLGVVQNELLFVLEEQLEMCVAISLIILSLGVYKGNLSREESRMA